MYRSTAGTLIWLLLVLVSPTLAQTTNLSTASWFESDEPLIYAYPGGAARPGLARPRLGLLPSADTYSAGGLIVEAHEVTDKLRDALKPSGRFDLVEHNARFASPSAVVRSIDDWADERVLERLETRAQDGLFQGVDQLAHAWLRQAELVHDRGDPGGAVSARVHVVFMLRDAHTGASLLSDAEDADNDGDGEEAIESLEFFGEATNDEGEGSVQERMTDVLDRAIAKACAGFLGRLIATESYPVRANIIKAEGDQVTLDLGWATRINPGEVFAVYSTASGAEGPGGITGDRIGRLALLTVDATQSTAQLLDGMAPAGAIAEFLYGIGKPIG